MCYRNQNRDINCCRPLYWEGVPEATRGNRFRREVKGGVLLTSPTV